VLERLRRLLPGLWAGVLLCIAAIAAPAAFALLERPLAGQMVGWFFAREAWLSLVAAVLLLAIERPRARAAAAAGRGSVLSTDMLLLLGTVFCTVAGYFALQPLMASARAGQGPLSFGQLHVISVAFFLAKLLCILALAWRAAGPAQGVSQQPAS
jgi:cation transport ATPase